MQNKTKLFSFILALAFLFLSFNLISASTTIGSLVPANGAVINGVTLINATVSYTGAGGSAAGYNCTFYMSSSSTANSTATALNATFGVQNKSTNSTWMYYSFTEGIFEDSNDYSLLAICSNDTGLVNITTTSTGITIDNTVPQAPSSLSPTDQTQLVTAITQTFTSTVVNVNTTGCTYKIGRGGIASDSLDTTSGTATYSASTCSFTKTFTDQNDNGQWFWQITASDGTNTTGSTTPLLQVQIPSAGGNLPVAQENVEAAKAEAKQAVSTKAILWIVGILAFIVIVAILMNRARRN